MEVLVTLTLIGVGYYFNKKGSDNLQSKRLKIKKKNSSKIGVNNIYDSNQIKRNNFEELKRATKRSINSKYPEKTNIIPNYYNSLKQAQAYNKVNQGNPLIQNEIKNKIRKSSEIVYLDRPTL